jgi:adenosylhomocysteine nucleosidase
MARADSNVRDSEVEDSVDFSIIVSADAEWAAVKPLFTNIRLEHSPYGEVFHTTVENRPILVFQGGWGKVAAAASTQYVVDRFKPRYLINLGTCGGVQGRIERFDVVAVERVIIYDVYEAMGDSSEAIAHYTTDLNVPESLPPSIIRTTLYSADRDLTPMYLRELENLFQPRVVDWESGAIAWVARRNGIPVLILRGVTDLANVDKMEAQDNLSLFQENASHVMHKLVQDLPLYLKAAAAAAGFRR